MAHIRIDKTEQTLTVDLSAVEVVESLHRDLTVPLSSVLSARVTDKALGEVFGMRFPGTGLPGLELVGTIISADLGRTVAVCHGRGEGVVIELDVDVAGFDRVVATVDDPEAIVAELS